MFHVFIMIYLILTIVTILSTSVAGGGTTTVHPVTVVSGYWTVKSKHRVSSYTTWFENTLKVRCPYVFFHDSQEVVNTVSDIRLQGNQKLYPTYFIQRSLSAAALKFNYSDQWTHPKHVKTAQLAVVWLDKVNMMADVAALNPYKSEWFAWIDAGIALYRTQRIPSAPWPNPSILSTLPRNKIIYSDSGSHPAHSFAGTAFMYHKDLVTSVQKKFMTVYASCVEHYTSQNKPRMLWVCGIDQGHFTRMKEAAPEMFVNTGVGYGTMVQKLFLPRLDPTIPPLYTKDLLPLSLPLSTPNPTSTLHAQAHNSNINTNFPQYPVGSRRKHQRQGKRSRDGRSGNGRSGREDRS